MYEDFLEYFSKRLIRLRMGKGVSARKMSLDIGQSKGYIAQLERKTSLPSMTVFFYICEYLGITPKEFFDDGIGYPEIINELIEGANQLTEEQLKNLNAFVKSINSH